MEAAIKQLTTEGYCRLPHVYRPDEVAQALDLVTGYHRRPRQAVSTSVPFLYRDQSVVHNLQSKDYYFLELLFASAEVQHILMHFLNDPWYKPIPQTDPNYILRSYLGRSSNTALALHIDSFIPYVGRHVSAMQMAIILEPQTEANGCTIVVPGSHNAGEFVDQSALKDAIPIESEAGDVVLWDSRLWHGTTANRSGRTRWSLIANWSRWWLKQGFNIPANVPQDIYARLTPSQKAILGYCSIPFDHESEGIDMKRGYDGLPETVDAYRPKSRV